MKPEQLIIPPEAIYDAQGIKRNDWLACWGQHIADAKQAIKERDEARATLEIAMRDKHQCLLIYEKATNDAIDRAHEATKQRDTATTRAENAEQQLKDASNGVLIDYTISEQLKGLRIPTGMRITGVTMERSDETQAT